MPNKPDILVAGHICLDIIPTLPGTALPDPGALMMIGPATVATGGAVSNTGQALHRLGTTTSLAGKVGNDHFGDVVLALVREQSEELAKGMIVEEGVHTSYTLVLSPAGVDRSFMHHTGANDSFVAADLPDATLQSARLMHFGYPSLMASMYQQDGAEIIDLFARAKRLGRATSLDTAHVDQASPAGKVDWHHLFEGLLPHVDVFVPSLDDIAFAFPDVKGIDAEGAAFMQGVSTIAQKILDMGVAIVMLKLGERGAYLRTAPDTARLNPFEMLQPTELAQWAGRELLAPCFSVEVVGATGAGDCAVAGFLAAMVRGCTPGAALTTAAAVGACNVEAPDAISGVPHWDNVRARIERGWKRRLDGLGDESWTFDDATALWYGPNDNMR